MLLSSGQRMPVIGLGTYKLASADAVKTALELGYRHFDCEWLGHSAPRQHCMGLYRSRCILSFKSEHHTKQCMPWALKQVGTPQYSQYTCK